MSMWSKGWISTAPVSAENSFAAMSASSMLRPWNRTSAPYPRVAFSLGIGAPSGMNTVDLMPSIWAASATPWAWLPALAATTPAAFSSADRRDIRKYAPRILNEPVRWRFSALIITGPPASAESHRDSSMGVYTETPRSSSLAISMSAKVGIRTASSVAASLMPPTLGPRPLLRYRSRNVTQGSLFDTVVGALSTEVLGITPKKLACGTHRIHA